MLSLRPILRALPVGLALAASAVYAAPRAVSPEIAPPAIRSVRLGTPSVQRTLTQGGAWRDFTARNGQWSVLWNEVTRTPHRAFGRGIQLQGFAGDRASADQAVRRFVSDNEALFGDVSDLELAAATNAGNLWYVRYRQTLGGIPVLFSSWEFRVGMTGKLVAFGADAHHPPASLLSQPRIGAGVAREAAKQGIAFNPAVDRVFDEAPLGILPYHDASGDYRLVYAVRVFTQKPRGNWFALVDASSGDVLYRKNHVLRTNRRDAPIQRMAISPAPPARPTQPVLEAAPPADRTLAVLSGTVWSRIHQFLPTDPQNLWQVPNMYVKLGTTQINTNASGLYSNTCTAQTTVTANMSGRYCRVLRVDEGANANFSSSTACPSTRDITWDNTNSLTAERDAYYHVNRAHDWIKAIDPAYIASDYDLGVSVNSIDDECVAYWDGFSITFGMEGDFCPYNIASMPDLVYREYCLRVNDDLYFAQGAPFGMTNEALQGGTSDAMAAFMTFDSVIGNDIEGSGTFLRDVQNTLRWPEDESSDANQTGLILAGAFWDLQLAVGYPVAQNLLHFAKYGLPGEAPPTVADDGVAMSEYFVETLVADDTDNDITNGTPHFNQILTAFNSHGIGTGNFLMLAHTELDDQLTNGPFPITATIQYTGPVGGLNLTSPKLYISVNGLPYAVQNLNPTGNPDEWGGEIPRQSGAIVKYYIEAAETYGGVRTDPPGAPLRRVHTFIAGPASTVISADMEADPLWTTSSVGTGVTGLWVRVDPNTDYQAAPEDDHSAFGTKCWVTGNAIPDDPPGTNDVDNGTVTLTTNTFSAVAGGITYPIIAYWRWFSNNGGDSPGTGPWKVEISNNNGTNWTTVENTTETDQSWRRVVFFIRDYLTPTSQMKVRFSATDLGTSLVEAGLDDFAVLGYVDPVSVDPVPRTLFTFSQAAPNPFRNVTRLRYTLPKAGPVTLKAFDIHGREVRSLVSGTQQPGNHSLQWDGADDAGRPLASGPYFLKLEQNGQRSTLAVVRIR